MEDAIHIEYDTIEQLFSKQQPVTVKPAEQKKSKQKTEVCRQNIFFSCFFSYEKTENM